MGPKNLGLKGAYLARREVLLKEWDVQLQQLEGQSRPGSTQVQYDRQLASLRTKHTLVRARLLELTQAAGDDWETVKIGLETAWNDLNGGLTTTVAKYQ